MPDPIQVERQFRETMELFETTISIRHRYHLFRNFIESLEGALKKFESYILQIVDELPEYTEPLTWTGIDPEQIEQDLALIDTIDSELQLSEKSENVSGVYNRLREVCILLYGCLDDFRGVNYHLQRLLVQFKLRNEDHFAHESVLDLLRNLIVEKLQNRKELSREEQEQLERILWQIKTIQITEDWKAFVPVAERYHQEHSEGEAYGRLRKISVEQYSVTENEDELIWNMHVYGATHPSLKEKKDVLVAARNLFESTAGNRNNNYYRGGINFEFQHAFHFGDSANLAISAIWFTRLLEASHRREIYKLNSHSVITGNVDKEGNVLPVYEETIGLKVQAAFFSWGKILVVPAVQRDLFEQELAELREKYPTRDLVLYGVNHLREIFFDRRLAVHQVEGLLSFYFKQVKSQKYRAVTVPLIIVLIGVIGWLIFGPVDQNPVDATYEGEYMILKNQYGQTIQSLEVGNRIVEAIQRSANEMIPVKTNFHDLNGDGINEVFYSRASFELNQSGPEELVAYSITGDSLIWKKNLSFDIEFPNKPDVEENGYLVYTINILKNDREDSNISIIANLGHVRFFPSLIVKLNAETGEETGRYVHTGRINQTETVDIDGDEEDEIVSLGQNNAFNEITVFFALEPDQISGHSPLTEEYTVTGYLPAKEIHYLQIPQTIIGQVFKRRITSNNPEYFHIVSEENTIRVRVHDFRLPENDPFRVNYATLIFMFDFNFNVLSIGTHSYYDLWAKNLYEEERIPFEPDHEYFEAFKDSLLYWDGEGFTSRENK